ncbi:MAG: hypothetical protein MZV49_04955 [Rhodopseudomonas palustris]|nr:hypothetical protein [Rhodopseudomonas palustris]
MPRSTRCASSPGGMLARDTAGRCRHGEFGAFPVAWTWLGAGLVVEGYGSRSPHRRR